jgi:hypothetical protein
MNPFELVAKIVALIEQKKMFMPVFQERTCPMKDIDKDDNITIRGFNGKTKRHTK